MITSSLKTQLTLCRLEDREVPAVLMVTNNLDYRSLNSISGDLASESPIPGSLRERLSAARDGDTVAFDPSLNGQTIQLLLTELEIDRNIRVEGFGRGGVTIAGPLAPDDPHRFAYPDAVSRIFRIDSNACAFIGGLTLTDGHLTQLEGPYEVDTRGGAILNLGTLELADSIISGNSVSNYSSVTNDFRAKGGAIFNDGSMAIERSTIADNAASGLVTRYGGGSNAAGGAVFNAGRLSIDSSLLIRNVVTAGAYGGSSAVWGGAIASTGTLCITDSAIAYNRAAADVGAGGDAVAKGGGLFATGTTALDRVAINFNVLVGEGTISPKAAGGGIYAEGAFSIQNSSVTANQATTGRGIDYPFPGTASSGGGIALENSARAFVANTTIAANQAIGTGHVRLQGGGVAVSGGSTLFLQSCTVAGNFLDGQKNGLNNPNAQAFGAGIAVDAGSQLTLYSSLVAVNRSWAGDVIAGDIGGRSLSRGFNLVGNSKGLLMDMAPSDLLDIHADLGPLLRKNGSPTLSMRPRPYSPAIRHGSPALAGSLDQNGTSRSDLPTIGAVEG